MHGNKGRKFCSAKCQSNARIGKKLPKETIDALSTSLKKKWASGTRKANPPEMYEVTSQKMKDAYASGRITYKPSHETRQKGLAARNMDNVREACRKTGKAKLGIKNPPGPSEAGPNNKFAKYWVIKSPAGVILRGKNLCYLVRENSAMFSKDDLKTSGGTVPVAAKRLGALFLVKPDGKPVARSWKGWTAILKSEEADASPHHGHKIVTLAP